MRFTRWIRAALVCAGVALAGGQVYSQDKGGKAEGGKPEGAGHGMTPEQQAEMEAWKKVATPGEHHKGLMNQVGEWEAAGKLWMDPAGPPTEMKARSKVTAILDGRYVVDEYDGGQMMGMPFRGHGTFGYDNITKKHTGVWLDTMGTAMMIMEGTCEGEGCKKTTYTATWLDPAGRKWGWKSVTTWESKDKYLFEAWNILPEGMPVPPGMTREHKAMEMMYTRKK